MKNINIYCIIVTYNGMKWVDRCLSNLRQSSVPVHVVVVDNHSTDETVGHIRSRFPEVHLMENVENRGFGQANNQGIAYAYKQGASHFFLLNQDTWIYEDTIAHLTEVQDKHQLSIVSPVHLNGGGNQLEYSFYKYTTMDGRGLQMYSDYVLKTLKDYYVTPQVNAAAWLISRETIEKIGGFNPVYFHYGEDNDYLCRLKYHGCQLAVVPKAVIHHDHEYTQLHGNEAMYLKHRVLNKLLSSFGDVNQSPMAVTLFRVKFVAAHWLLWLKLTLTLRWKGAWLILSDYFLFFKRLPLVLRNRRANQAVGAHWLNLE